MVTFYNSKELCLMGNALKRFEVSVYNKFVREYDEQNKIHPNFNNSWARLNFLVFEANSQDEVIQLVRRKHPERKGFVIDKIVEVKEYEFIKPVGVR